MPKFPKGFGRRKSAANVFEDVQESRVVEHSFKVFERSDGGSKSFDGGVKLARTMPVGRPKTSHRVEENMFEDLLTSNRGSGASNTNTASTTDNSSRLSAASTAPSSTDISGREEGRSPNDIPVPPIPKTQSAFSLKNAGRSLSWGWNNNKASTHPPKELPPTPVEYNSTPGRARAVTASSYASTATPPKLDEKDLDLSLGGDFGDMFAGFDKRKSAILLQQQSQEMSQSPEMLPTEPASRPYSGNRYNPPPPLNIDKDLSVGASPYSWSSHHSQDGLISNSTPPPFAPPDDDKAPQVPRHTSPTSIRTQRPDPVPDMGLRRSSGVRRESALDYDEDARLLRESVNASRRLNEPSNSPKVRDSWALPSDKAYTVDESTISGWSLGAAETTPGARKPVLNRHIQEDSLFDNRIAASANLAQQFQDQPTTPLTTYKPPNKVMTPAQFERYKQDQERLRSFGGRAKQEDEDEDDEHYDDDEDEAEKAKQLAKQRRKQEAHMSVYRQQMMKVTGEQASAGPSRPGMSATQSTPNLTSLGKAEEAEEEDEEVPLAILQAHGFPNKNKPPMRSMGSNPNLRAQSVIGGADDRLPVFARNLPQDPYFGAGIVNPAHRESLAFGGGAGSVTGATSRGLPPGGLVGVIATEERSRAMRRGSPNPQGEYGPTPSTGFNGIGMPQNPSMMNGMGMPPMGMNPMMMTPGEQAQIQMSQQMQQFMQMQMQFMQMMTAGQGPPQQNGQQSLGQTSIPGSPSLRPTSSHQQRAMTMMDPNSAPWLMPQASTYSPSIRNSGIGYAPSLAPSERSNIGLPGRYRPVSHAPPADTKSRASIMSGALNGWESKNGSTTIKAVHNSGNVSDEDEEEGWEEMAKKREKKKSLWRTKKDANGLKDLFGFAQS